MGRRRRPAAHHGVLLVDKPKGPTSHDVVARVRRHYGQPQVGHTGTLDPMATGLMVVTLGKATRLAQFLEATEKTYLGTITLGVSTTTYDAEGEVVETAPVLELTVEQVEAAARGLVGELQQEVPAFSAVKVGGERLYAKARRQEEVELPVRTVVIHRLEVLRVEGAEVDVEVTVSKGTYIRSLAVQLGAALGLPAHLSALRRTGVGPYRVGDAWPAPEPGAERPDPLPTLIPPGEAVAFLPALFADPIAAEGVAFGRQVLAGRAKGEGFRAGDPVRVVAPDGALLAVGHATVDAAALAEAPPGEPAVRYACVLVDTSLAEP